MCVNYRIIVILLFGLLIGSSVLAADVAQEQRVAIKNISSDQPIYFTVFMEQTTRSWPFKKSTIIIPKQLPIVELMPNDEDSVSFGENYVALLDNGVRKTIQLDSNQQPFLVFARFRDTLIDISPESFADDTLKQLITSMKLTSISSDKIFADVKIEAGFEQEFSPKLTSAGISSHIVHVFNEATIRHPKDIELKNQSTYPIFAAAYQCHVDSGDITQNKHCHRLSNTVEIAANTSLPMKDISYDVRVRDYSSLSGNSYFSYLIMSRMEDDLIAERDLRDSNMRHVMRSTRRAYNAIYDLGKNPNTARLWLDVTLNGIYVADSYLDFSKITKALQDAAVGLASWLSWKDYEKWAKPFKDLINDIAKDQHRFVDSSVREGNELPRAELDFLERRKIHTKMAFQNLGIEGEHLPIVATCMSGGGYRAMLASTGLAMGLNDIGVFDTLTYQAGLSGSSWYLSKYMSMASDKKRAKKSGPPDLEAMRRTLIERVQNIRFPQYKQQVQIAYTMAPLFKKFIYYQPITPVDLYGILLGATLLDLGSPTYVNHTFSSFAPVISDGSLPMPIGTAITKTNAHWFEITPFEVGSAELSAFIPSFSFGRTYREGIAVDNALEITLHNTMGFMGSAFALKGFDFLRHLGPNLDFLPAGLSESLQNIAFISKNAGLFSMASGFAEDKIGVSFEKLMSVIKGTADNSIGYWQKLYDSMPYGFVFIAKPEIGKEGLGWQSQSAIPAGIVPNPFYKLKEGAHVFSERYTELRDAGIDFNLPFPPLLRDERRVNVIIAFDASADILENGATALKFAEEYAEKHGLKYPDLTDDELTKASSQNLAVIGDADDPNALTIIYISLLKNSHLPSPYGDYSPLDDPKTSTFNFSYPPKNSSMLIDTVRQNVVFHRKEILDVLRRKSGMAHSSQ